MRLWTILAISLALTTPFLIRSAELSPDEAKAQADFKKAFTSSDVAAKKAACKVLSKAVHPSSWQLLATAASIEKDRDAKWAAFQALCFVPSHDPNVAKMAAKIFKDVDRTDRPMKLYFARAMEHLAYKADVVAVLVDYIVINLRYPEYITADQSMVHARNQQEEFVDMIKVFNKITGAAIEPSQTATNAIKKWYQDAKADLEKDDREVFLKNKQ